VDGLRTLAALAFAVAAASGSAHAQQPSPSPSAPVRLPVFPGGVEQVVVDVVVVDDKGQAVTGLTAQDFELAEEGGAREILSFEAVAPEEAASNPTGVGQARLTRVFGVVFDDLHLTAASGERVKAALANVLRSVLRDSDEVAVLRTSSPQAWAGRVGEDRAALLAAIEGLRGLRPPARTCDMSDEEAKQIFLERDIATRGVVFNRFVKCGLLLAPPVPLVEGNSGVAAAAPPMTKGGEGQLEAWAFDLHQANTGRIRSTYRTLEGLLRALSPLRGRKSVILASDGFVRDRGLAEVKGVVTAASDANAAVYFLDARDLTAQMLSRPADAPMAADSAEMERQHKGRFFAAEATELLAEDTGGTIIRGADLAQGLRRLVDESRSYYLLGYSPGTRALDGGFRGIRVNVRRPGVTVRARRGYYAVPRAGPPPANIAVTVPSVPRSSAPPVSETVAVYAAGVDVARAKVATWSADQADKAVAALKSSNAPDDVVETAALAHAAAALAGPEPREHQARAAGQAAALVRDAARRSALETRVLLGLAHRFLDARNWQMAQELAQEATTQMVDDASALLALGIVQETTGSVVDAGRRPNPDQTVLTAGFDEMVSRNPVSGFAAGVPGGPAGRAPEFRRAMSRPGALTAEARLRRAAESYRRALKARPDFTEARLRLGRTLALLGEAKPAQQELQAVAGGSDAEMVYLARLFLGDLQEQEGDFAGALTEYRAALAARPGSAVARLAVARAQQAAGDRGAAQAAIESLLLAPPADAHGDPWWRYRLRPLGRWADALPDAS
jgi:VWFA-related protein